MDNQRGSQSHPREVGGPWQGSVNNATHQNPHGGMRRRPQRSSHSESHASEEHLFFPETYGSVQGSRGEFVWFNSNMYEQAEDYFQSPPSSGTSPREQVVHRSLVFRAKKKPTRPSREEGNPVRSRSYSAQKNQRSSSEPQRGRRKRGYSETERPTPRKRDKYATFQGIGQACGCLLFVLLVASSLWRNGDSFILVCVGSTGWTQMGKKPANRLQGRFRASELRPGQQKTMNGF